MSPNVFTGKEKKITEPTLTRAMFERRENGHSYHGYDEELLQYELMRDGDLRSVEENKKIFRGNTIGTLSKNPLQNKKFMFIATATLTARFAIEGGMPTSTAYLLSDLYSQKMDTLTTIDEINELASVMMQDYTTRMAEIKSIATLINSPELTSEIQAAVLKGNRSDDLGKVVSHCLDYVQANLHERITLEDIGAYVGFSPNYLDTLFRKQTGLTIQQYIRGYRIETAKRMLLYTDYTVAEIAEYLAFSSPSHFTRVFREQTGQTPKEFERTHYQHHDRWRGNEK